MTNIVIDFPASVSFTVAISSCVIIASVLPVFKKGEMVEIRASGKIIYSGYVKNSRKGHLELSGWYIYEDSLV